MKAVRRFHPARTYTHSGVLSFPRAQISFPRENSQATAVPIEGLIQDALSLLTERLLMNATVLDVSPVIASVCLLPP